MSLREEIEKALAPLAVQVQSLERLGGGASQESWRVRMRIDGNGERDVVLRRDMGGALGALSRTRFEERALMSTARAAGVPVPDPLFEPLRLDGKQAFFMEYLPGETIGRRLVRDPAYANARAVLPEQAMGALVRLHAIDSAALPFVQPPMTALDLLDGLERDLDACGDGHPALELGLRWLRLHAPTLERTALVHGDFRIGNFVVGSDGLIGILDWELAHTGDPDEDLGWFCVQAWRFGADDLPAGGITTRERLLELHRAAGGHEVPLERLRYWELFGNVKWGIIALTQAARHLTGEAPSVELATLGRLVGEMEWETLHLLSEARA
jgi:aminoglycoside phosphotransferase (APT) family kinase protein